MNLVFNGPKSIFEFTIIIAAALICCEVWRRHTIRGNIWTLIHLSKEQQKKAKRRLAKKGSNALAAVELARGRVAKELHELKRQQIHLDGEKTKRNDSELQMEKFLLIKNHILLDEAAEYIRRS